MALTASAGLLGSQLIIGLISQFHPSYVSHTWHQFLIYLAYTLVAALINAFGNRLLPYVNQVAIFWSITGFAVISITILACKAPNYNSAKFVFTDFINETGWPDGVAWLLGLLQGGLGLTGYDATAHMVEEIPNAAVEAPKILIYCVLIGMFTGFIFLMCLLFVAGEATKVINSAAGPLGYIFYNATGSLAGTACLLIFPLMCLMFAGISIMTTSSRMTYAFARDGGLPFSKFLARVHPKLDVPLEALGFTVIVVIIFGCIELGSTSAFNAILSASVVALGLTYGIPVAINVLRGRRMLPETRAFKMPEWLAWPANILGIVYAILTTVLFVFPPVLPVTGPNMNYCIVAFAIVLIISMIQWFIDGRKNYTGPQIEIDPNILTAEQSAEINAQMEENGGAQSSPDRESLKKDKKW